MPFEQLVPTSTPSWIRDVGFLPNNTRSNKGANLGLTQIPSYRKSSQASAIPDFLRRAAGGAGSFDLQWNEHRSQPCVTTQPAAFHCSYWWAEDQFIDLNLEQLGIDPGDMFKVWIDEVFVAFQTPITLTTDDKPLLFSPVDGLTEPVLTAVLGNQYGIRADGAGGFEYYSTINGVQTEAVAVTWPTADLSEWVRVRAEHFGANASRGAQVRFWLNDTIVITRLWSGGLLPDYDEVGITANHFRRMFDNAAGSTDMHFCQFRSRAGNFDAAGTAVL